MRYRRGKTVARAICLLAGLLAGCSSSRPAAATEQTAAASVSPLTRGWFSDQAGAAGLGFVHFNGMSGRFYNAEIFGPGVALLDYDDDGDLDVFVVQGQMLGKDRTLANALFTPPPGPLHGHLYRNDLQVRSDGSRSLHFTDVTASSAIDAHGYGMGVAVGDYDNDGWPDLYVTNLGANQLFHNNGNGTFTDVTRNSGTEDGGWSVSASFVDIDRDGWLDLYVGHYLQYNVESDVPCFGVTGARDYCSPREYRPQSDRLYRNRHDGTFVDVTATALDRGSYGPALGVATADFNGDGWPDIYVANDGRDNVLWMNERGRFRNTAVAAGAAVNADGQAQAGMGVEAADFDNDGDDDLFVTNWRGETNTLYVNDGRAVFEDRTATSGLGPASLPMTGFGTGAVDIDNDGWLDIVVVNGGVIAHEAQVRAGSKLPLREAKQLFLNRGHARFEDVTRQAGEAFTSPGIGRGAAFGDIDNDGDIDIVVGNNNGPIQLLVNEIGNRNQWLGLRLLQGRRIAVGARVHVTRVDGSSLWRRARADGSYASASDPRVLIGLGRDTAVKDVDILWPDGRRETRHDVPVDRWTTLQEGSVR